MKKVVLLVAVLLTILSPLSYCEDIDLTKYTNDELLELYSRITEEIDSRFIIRSDNLTEGGYIAGIDIAPGGYVVTSGYDGPIAYMVLDTAEEYYEYESMTYDEKVSYKLHECMLLGKEDTRSVHLENGQVFYNMYGTIHLREMKTRISP